MSRNFRSLLFAVGVGIVTWIVAPYLSSDVDKVWWVGQIPGTNDIIGRDFLVSSLTLGSWFASLMQSVSELERKTS